MEENQTNFLNFDVLNITNKIFTEIRCISKQIDDLFGIYAEEKEMTVLQYMIVLVLGSKESYSMPVGKLGELVGITGGNISNITKQIEEMGYIKKSKSKEDERIVEIRLTNKGICVCDEANTYLGDINDKLGYNETNEEMVELINALVGLRKQLAISIYIGNGYHKDIS